MRRDDRADVKHEVLFEDALTPLKHRSLFLGRALSGRRFFAARVFLGMVLVVLIGRAGWMQVARGADFQQQSENNRLREAPLLPRRGIIRDRQGRILADNIPRFQVTMTPMELPRDPAEMESDVSLAARVLGLSVNDLLPMANATGSSRDEAMIIADQVSYRQAMDFAVAWPDLQGFSLEVAARRRYPWSHEIQSLSHVLGYVGKLSPEEYQEVRGTGYRRADEIGKSGVERGHEEELRGALGARTSEVDAHGRVKALVGERPAEDGTDLSLALDLDLQRAAEQALRKGLESANVDRGSAIALDPRTGEVLAAVSWPAYDNNIFSGGVSSTAYAKLINDDRNPLFPRVWAGTYPSGSTVKIVIAVAALAEKVISANTSIMSVGGIQIGGSFFPDWKAGGHGPTNVRSAIAWSVNTFFYTVGGGYESFVGLGVDRLGEWMRKFGLGSETGLDLPGEREGLVPTREWKEKTKGERWFVGDTYNLSIGQGDLLVTPVQVAAYTAAIANGGYRIEPHFARTGTSTEMGERLADASIINTVRQGMRDNITYGSGRALSTMPFPVAGKTGTAQWHSEKDYHAWFTSFAPYENPEIVVTVLLEEGGEGSAVSVPVARDILQAWWDLRKARQGIF
ncbi:penicillin-binding protein 2 [Patescibacteria group bacterium]|jgi:penicillin-binding protein 2|nr:penicillin-binding protein 2 [Patescibacteria group bacterium]